MKLFVFPLMILSVSIQKSDQDTVCMDKTVVANFKLQEYLGKWIEVQRIRHYDDNEGDGECVTAEYSLGSDGKVVVNNTVFLKGEWKNRLGKAQTRSPDSKDGKLVVSFDNFKSKADYWVLDTDYENFAVVYSCRPEKEFAWVLSRESSLGDYTSRINTVLQSNNVPNLKPTKQVGCTGNRYAASLLMLGLISSFNFFRKVCYTL